MPDKEISKYIRKDTTATPMYNSTWSQGFTDGYADALYGFSKLIADWWTTAYKRGYHDGWYHYESTLGARERARQEQLNQTNRSNTP